MSKYGRLKVSRVENSKPYYATQHGAAFHDDSLEVLRALPSGSFDFVVTSPPYALQFKKEYGNPEKADYQAWMIPFAIEIHHVLKSTGSFVLNIGGSYN